MFESNLLTQVNVNTPIPTFVEVHLINSLNSTMHEAFVFLHALLADRYDQLSVALPYSSELFYALWGTLEWRLLSNVDATFAEYLFGLKRSLLSPSIASVAPALTSSRARQQLTFIPLTHTSRVMSWLSVIVYPYLRRLLRLKYEKLTAGTVDVNLERQAMERRYGRLAKVLHWAVLHLYPVFHVLSEGSSFVFLVAFMLQKTPFQSLWQLIWRVVLKRTTMRDQMAASANPSTRNVLVLVQVILSALVLGFRVLEWRRGGNNNNNTEANTEQPGGRAPLVSRPDVEDQTNSTAAAATAAQPQPEVVPGTCPVCQHRVTNAAVNTASGIVCCYPCLQTYVAQHGTCPVTGTLTIPQNIRRLYEV